MRGITEIAAIIVNRSSRWERVMYLRPGPFYPRDTTPDTNLIESGVGPSRCVPSPGTEPRFLGWPTGNLVNYTGAVIPDPDVEINKPNFNP